MAWWVWALVIAFPLVVAGGCVIAGYCDVQDFHAKH